MGFSDQLSFYTTILPQFSSGAYSGLKVPINLSSNHSIPEVCAQIWPNTDKFVLSSGARTAAGLINASILAFLSWMAYRNKESVCVLASFVVLMVLVPVYTYEHHLVFLLFPLVVLWTHIRGRWEYILAGICTFFIFWPLMWWRGAQKLVPELQWVFKESKMLAALGVMVMLCYCAEYSRDRAS